MAGLCDFLNFLKPSSFLFLPIVINFRTSEFVKNNYFLRIEHILRNSLESHLLKSSPSSSLCPLLKLKLNCMCLSCQDTVVFHLYFPTKS
jgi:hypothetical protein